MVTVLTKFKDGLVTLYLNDEIKLEEAVIDGADFEYGLNIGSYVDEKWSYDEEQGVSSVTVTRSDADYDTAYVGKDASLFNVTVSDDGSVFVDEGGKIGGIIMTGGLYSGAGICENVQGWYGAGICLTGSNGTGEVHLSRATFSGCEVFPSGSYTGHGGAIETYGAVLTVENSVFTGNKANDVSAAGGAIAILFSTTIVTGSTFSGNVAYFGGGIQQNAGDLTVTGTLFTENRTEGDVSGKLAPGGGALEIHNGATAKISGGTFSENFSRSGGAIYNDTFDGNASDVTVATSIFDGNTADYQGGAIYNYASMSVSDSEFTGNMVIDTGTNSYTSFGGAIANTNSGSLTVTGGVFSENSAVQGGAIATFIQPWGSDNTADLKVTGATFSDNAATYGGGIYIQTGEKDATVISDTDFSGNTASYGGGAICRCYGAMTVTGGAFTSNSADGDGGAIAVWDSWDNRTSISGATFVSNTALYGGAISHSYAAAPLLIYGCTFTSNGAAAADDASGAVSVTELVEETPATDPDGETAGQVSVVAEQGGAIWNASTSTGTVTVNNCTFSGNVAGQGGSVWNGGSMNLENVTLSTSSDTIYNGGTMAFSGVNTLGAEVVNDGRILFDVAAGADALISDLGMFGGTGTFVVALEKNIDLSASAAAFAASAGTFTGSLAVKYGSIASIDFFTLDSGVVGNDLAVAGNAVFRLTEDNGALSVEQEILEDLVPVVSKDGSILVWADAASTAGHYIEIAENAAFGTAIRIATDGASFDIAGGAGDFSGRAAREDGEFTADSVSWTAEVMPPRQIESSGNGRSDIFFASVSADDVWSKYYFAKNVLTGETQEIAGKNHIRDTFTGSASDANILYLSDTDNGDALFMDDVFSEFGMNNARLNLIREIRAGAGDDVVDMTSDKFSAELAGMTVRGGEGDDVLWGASGGNSLFGDAGDDRIAGGTGDDLIAGGAGDDFLQGCGGADLFTFGENWGNDVVSQTADGTVELWFLEDVAQISYSEIDGDTVFTNADKTSSVTVKGIAFADLIVHYGDDASERFAELAAAGAFLGSTSEAVFETENARTGGILASL